jgi:hypothetical protein
MCCFHIHLLGILCFEFKWWVNVWMRWCWIAYAVIQWCILDWVSSQKHGNMIDYQSTWIDRKILSFRWINEVLEVQISTFAYIMRCPYQLNYVHGTANNTLRMFLLVAFSIYKMYYSQWFICTFEWNGKTNQL